MITACVPPSRCRAAAGGGSGLAARPTSRAGVRASRPDATDQGAARRPRGTPTPVLASRRAARQRPGVSARGRSRASSANACPPPPLRPHHVRPGRAGIDDDRHDRAQCARSPAGAAAFVAIRDAPERFHEIRRRRAAPRCSARLMTMQAFAIMCASSVPAFEVSAKISRGLPARS